MSYGVNAPQGFRPCQYINGSSWSGQMNQYQIAYNYATQLFTGDAVILTTDGTIQRAALNATTTPIGVFMGCKYYDTTNTFQNLPFWPAPGATLNNGNATALVVDDPNVLYDIQTDGTVYVNGAALTDLYNNAVISATATGNTRTGQSGMQIGTAGNTAANPIKLYALTPNPNNSFGIQYNNLLVLLNNNPFKADGVAGI